MLQFLIDNVGQTAAQISPSPLGRWLNGKLVRVEPTSLEVEFIVREEFTNPLGVLHGGVISAILDEVIGMTSFGLEKQAPFVSTSLNVSFLRTTRTGETVLAKSKVVQNGRTLLYIECELLNQDQKLVAKATSNMAVLPSK